MALHGSESREFHSKEKSQQDPSETDKDEEQTEKLWRCTAAKEQPCHRCGEYIRKGHMIEKLHPYERNQWRHIGCSSPRRKSAGDTPTQPENEQRILCNNAVLKQIIYPPMKSTLCNKAVEKQAPYPRMESMPQCTSTMHVTEDKTHGATNANCVPTSTTLTSVDVSVPQGKKADQFTREQTERMQTNRRIAIEIKT